MYKVSIPIMSKPIERMGREKFLSELKRAKADRVFLCLSVRGIELENVIKDEIDALKKNVFYFKQAGFEVGVWINTLGHGGALAHESGSHEVRDYTRITGFEGKTCEDSFCPLDEGFGLVVCKLVKMIAQAGPDMIMLDDDYRLAFRGYIGCCCDLHMAEYQKLVGEKIFREELRNKIFCGPANKYRDAWLEMTGKTLTDFAAKIRTAVDSADETIRLSSCAAPSSCPAPEFRSTFKVSFACFIVRKFLSPDYILPRFNMSIKDALDVHLNS